MAPQSRFPLNEAPGGGAEAKQVIQDALHKMHQGEPPFPWIEDDGSSLLGCYAALSYSPDVARQFFEVGKSVYTGGVLRPRIRELVVLGLSSVLNVPYVRFTHKAVAERAELTEAQRAQGLRGETPQGLLGDDEELAYRLGRQLSLLNGPLDDHTFSEVTAKLSKTEFVAIVHAVGGYRWIALLEQVGADSRWDNE